MENENICKICKKKYKTHQTLLNHNKKSHPEEVNIENMQQQTQLIFNCSLCNKDFTQEQDKMKHEKTCKKHEKTCKKQPSSTVINNHNDISQNDLNEINKILLDLFSITSDTPKKYKYIDFSNNFDDKFTKFKNVAIIYYKKKYAYIYEEKINSFILLDKDEFIDNLGEYHVCNIFENYDIYNDELNDVVKNQLDEFIEDRNSSDNKEKIKLILFNEIKEHD